METKKIEVSPNKFEDFEVVPFEGKIGDIVYFLGGFYEDQYEKGIIEDINPDDWYIYADGEKCLGAVYIKSLEDNDLNKTSGGNYKIYFKDVLTEPQYQALDIRKTLLKTKSNIESEWVLDFQDYLMSYLHISESGANIIINGLHDIFRKHNITI